MVAVETDPDLPYCLQPKTEQIFQPVQETVVPGEGGPGGLGVALAGFPTWGWILIAGAGLALLGGKGIKGRRKR